jgi:hypothetical protein
MDDSIKQVYIPESMLQKRITPSAIKIYVELFCLSDNNRTLTIENKIISQKLNIATRTVEMAIDELTLNKYITQKITTPEDKVRILINKKMNNTGHGTYKCEWCKTNTTVIHSHHYPVSKKNKGTDTVNICPNCHCEFHNGFDKIFIINMDENEFLYIKNKIREDYNPHKEYSKEHVI